MNKIIAIAAISMTLAGCSRLSYEETQAQVKYCEDRGLKSDIVQNGINAVSHVMCVDSEGARYYPEGQ